MAVARTFLGILAAGLLSLAGAANATLIVTAGVDNTGTDNVLANGCDAGVAVPGPALQVIGCLNTNHATAIRFNANENVSYTGGQAVLAPQDGLMSFFRVSAPPNTFNKLIVNVDGSANGVLRFSDGVSPVVDVALGMNGQNFYISTTGPFDFISVTSFAGTVGNVGAQTQLIVDVTQVRIGGLTQCGIPGGPSCGVDVPEPASLAVLGFSLLGLGLVSHRRRH